MNIYFAGSIRGGRDDKNVYLNIIKHLSSHGTILTEHVGDNNLSEWGEDGPNDSFIYTRDMKWLGKATVLVAEVTNPSLGVGYEIAMAENKGVPILYLYRPSKGKRLSAMISGSSDLTVEHYKSLEEAKKIIDSFLAKLFK